MICDTYFITLSYMKILHISDTHGMHHRLLDLPQADVIVHSGDFSMNGTESEAIDFLNWFCDLQYRYKIFICGNHDECLYGADIQGLDDNVYYLNNTSIEIEGIKFYGIPLFMSDAYGRQDIYYKAIPDDIDVLITHSPPHGILDYDMKRHWGSNILLARVKEINPSLHLFGHIHRHHGTTKIGTTEFSNATIMNDDYTLLQCPNLLDLSL